METLKQLSIDLFLEWKLDIWANILEVIGFLISIASILIGLRVKSLVTKLRTEHLFDKTVNKHIKKLETASSEINNLLNSYDINRQLIKVQFSICISELKDIIQKIPNHKRKSKQVLSFLISRNKRTFAKHTPQMHAIIEFITKYPKRIYQTTEDDVWTAYRGLKEVIVQLENVKSNRRHSL